MPKATYHPPWVGRQKGTPNRATVDLAERIRAAVQKATRGKVKDYDPIEQMAICAVQKSTPLGLRITCHKEVAEYIYAKKRSVTVGAEEGGPMEVRMRLMDRLLEKIEPKVIEHEDKK